MSNERDTSGEDLLVADTYRELASERVPDRLNDKVLRLAARAGRSRYSRALAWMRPVAWAATITLCLAIVLELTRLPQMEVAPHPVPEAAPERPDKVSMDEFVPQDMGVLREAEDRARAQAGPDQLPVAPRAGPDKFDTEKYLADEVSPVASAAAVANKETLKLDLACPAKEREFAKTWFECIENLRENGLEIRAESEYEAFQRKFPDFVDSQSGK